MPAYGALNSSIFAAEDQNSLRISANARGITTDKIDFYGAVDNQLDTGSGNDRLMGITTGLGEDKLTGLDTGSGNDRLMGITSGLGEDKLTALDNHVKQSNWDVICDVGTSIKQDGIDLQSDALVQNVNDIIGYEMQTFEYFSHNPEWFTPGSTVDAIGTSNPMGIEPDQMVGVISRGDIFVAANELRSDNRF